jgi:hypothetical protein
MSAPSLGFLSAVMSAVCLALLAASDPKRLAGGRSAFARWRLVAVILAALPGAFLAMTGRWVAFLIWLGIAAMLGWMIAVLFSAFASRHAQRDGGQQPAGRR